jgi:hypothetical protein
MSENITIIDDFFSHDEISKITNYFSLQKSESSYSELSSIPLLDESSEMTGSGSHSTQNKNVMLWKCQCLHSSNTSIHNDVPFWRRDLSNEFLFSVELKNIIIHKLQKKFSVLRVYTVSQTYSQDGMYHMDDDADEAYTGIIYINDNYDESSDGHFYIKTPENTILSIEPIFNRFILFPATYRHKGAGYSRFDNNLRICIARKLFLN